MDQAIIIHIGTKNLPEGIHPDSLEEEITAILSENDLGEFDGVDQGQGEIDMFIYGPDAEKIYSAIETTLNDSPLCVNARIEIRKGPPGSPQREVVLTN